MSAIAAAGEVGHALARLGNLVVEFTKALGGGADIGFGLAQSGGQVAALAFVLGDLLAHVIDTIAQRIQLGARALRARIAALGQPGAGHSESEQADAGKNNYAHATSVWVCCQAVMPCVARSAGR